LSSVTQEHVSTKWSIYTWM